MFHGRVTLVKVKRAKFGKLNLFFLNGFLKLNALFIYTTASHTFIRFLHPTIPHNA